MVSLFLSFAVLLIGFLTYGRLVDRVFKPDDRKTPAIGMEAAWTSYR